MSLLLDALKKAADDKQKASKIESESSAVRSKGSIQSSQINNDAGSETAEVAEELSLQNIDEKSEVEREEENNDTNVFTFDNDREDATLNKSVEDEDLNLEKNNRTGSDALAISDEALSMLIYKTNRDVKTGRRLLFLGVFIISLTILASGGLFYYTDMQAEISALERKHQIAMQSMRSKTNKEQTPSKSEIIRNLVNDTDLEKKVLYAKQRISNEKNTGAVNLNQKENITKQTNVSVSATILSIQKTKKSDPVGEKLDAAWLAYESGQYAKSAELYQSVLSLEEKNRDALLGLGAIAVIEQEPAAAKNIYMALLELDPQDPIATAALANLHDSKVSMDSKKDYLLSILKKNPDAHHLNFALGNIYAQQHNWVLAQQFYFNAWQNNNENADYLFNLAVSMDQLNKPKQAVKFYKECLSKSNNKLVSFSQETVRKRISKLSEL